jgi:hypothetical protein
MVRRVRPAPGRPRVRAGTRGPDERHPVTAPPQHRTDPNCSVILGNHIADNGLTAPALADLEVHRMPST